MRLKHLARLQYGDSLAVDARENGDVRVYGSNGQVGVHSTPNFNAPGIVVGRKGSYGKVTWATDGGFCIDTAYYVDRSSTQANLRYVFYLLSSLRLDEGSRDSAVPGLDRQIAHDRVIPKASLDTQKAIADFLDRETVRIDQLIEKKERLVALLGEKRRSIVDRAVSGDGTEGCREVPRMRLRYMISVGPSSQEARRLALDSLVTFAPMEALKDGLGGLDTSQECTLADVSSGSYNYFAEGDILLAKVTPCFENGKKALATGLANGCGYATSEVHVLRPDPHKINPRFLLYLLSGEDFRAEGMASMTGAGGLRRVAENAILNHRPRITDIDTQKAIADFLDRETAKLSQAAMAIAQSIDLLREYRAALITAAVTGEIDVATWRDPAV